MNFIKNDLGCRKAYKWLVSTNLDDVNSQKILELLKKGTHLLEKTQIFFS